MTDITSHPSSLRSSALTTVVLGTMLFVVIVGIVSRAVSLTFQREAAASARALVTVRLTGAMLGEIVVLILLVQYLRGRGRSLRDLGLWKTSRRAGGFLPRL